MIDAKLRRLQKSPTNPDGEILHFVRRTGRAELDEHAEPVNASEYILIMNPDCGKPPRRGAARIAARSCEAEVPGVEVEAEQPLAHLISHMLSGVNAQIAIKIYGDDLDTLRAAGRARSRPPSPTCRASTPPVVEPSSTVDEVHVRLRPDDLAFYGVSRAYVGRVRPDGPQGRGRLAGGRGAAAVRPGGAARRAVPHGLRQPGRAAARPAGRPGQVRLTWPTWPTSGRRGRGAEPGQPGERPPPAGRPLQRPRPRPGRRRRRTSERARGPQGRRCPRATSSSTAGSSRASGGPRC